MDSADSFFATAGQALDSFRRAPAPSKAAHGLTTAERPRTAAAVVTTFTGRASDDLNRPGRCGRAGPELLRRAPCIDPDFAALGGPTASSLYGSASSFAAAPVFAWTVNFAGGNVDFFNLFKTFDSYVRAVRGGSCN